MNSTTLCKRHSKQEKAIKRRIYRHSKWSVRCPKRSWENYLKALIVEDKEQLDALSRSYLRNFNRRVRNLENLLSIKGINENTHRGILGIWKKFRLRKLKEEYDMLIEIKNESSQFKYMG